MSEKILVVEDEPALQETIAYNLKKQGYEVEIVGDGHAALEAARKLTPDLLLLDIMLPGLDGFEITRILRRGMNIPIIMLTARDDEIDRVVGLEMGADDYLTKPFSMRELMARVKAQLRRSRLHKEELQEHIKEASPQEALIFNNLIINTTRHEVTLNKEVLILKPKEYELLLFFAEHRGQMLSRELILERVWGWDYVGDSRTVDVHIRWLRKKIEADPSKPERLITVRGGGYRFEG
ncbi:MAG: response regulator transcription factor [Anaerolineae bacterium]|jgi:DNA-binding response OmpR family regulator|nr:response regulator transcription factor [Anaerolineae bacterium]MBT7070031.1 response regulator transcription factor [Anaerolineae bacterium]MBT7325308.1 response regulator transcription factor [Anaerolineae bacterium]